MTKGRKPASVVAGKQPVREILKPSPWLSKYAKAEWRRVMPALVERRTLDMADLGNFENYCVAQGVVRECSVELATAGLDLEERAKLFRIQDKAMQTARQLAALFGLTPVDRSRPTIPNADDDGELDFLG